MMIKFCLAGAAGDWALQKTQVYTTLELRMKCGVGKCGRCNIGTKYVCKDGPVFRFDQVDDHAQRILRRTETYGKHGKCLFFRQEILRPR